MTSEQEKQVQDVINSLIESTIKTQIPHRFFHISERTPEDCQEVVVITEDCRVDFAYFSAGPGDQKFISYPSDINDVEWWMPAPRRQAA